MSAHSVRGAVVYAPSQSDDVEDGTEAAIAEPNFLKHLGQMLNMSVSMNGMLFLNFTLEISSRELQDLRPTGGSFMLRFAGRCPQQFRADIGDQIYAPRASILINASRRTAMVAFSAHVADLQLVRGPFIPVGRVHLQQGNSRRTLHHNERNLRVPEECAYNEDGSVRHPHIAELLDRQRQPLF